MSEMVRVGIIGTGWGVDIHAACLKNCEQAEIVAICGRQEEKTEKIADELGGIAWYTDYVALLERPELDAVVVATPDDLHHQIVMDALDRKLHVLCEKPLAENAARALEMWDRAVAEGVKHMTFCSWHWVPHLRYLKTLMDDGCIGRPLELRAIWSQAFKLNAENYSWRMDSRRTVGTIADLGAHLFYVSRFLFGPITTVQASLRAFTEKPSYEGRQTDSSSDSAHTLLGFETDAHGVLAVLQAAMGAGLMPQFDVVGDGGTLRLTVSPQDGFSLCRQRVGETEPEVLALPTEVAGPTGMRRICGASSSTH